MALVQSESKVSAKGTKDGEEITIFEITFAFDESVPEEVGRLIANEVGLLVAEIL